MRSFVVMTALPPTKGHLKLIQFANWVAPEVHVIVSTQPDEPYVFERVAALRESVLPEVRIHHLYEKLPQDPETPGFWGMWKTILESYGITKDDLIVASEPYGMKLAEITGTRFIPYDLERELTPIKATEIRDDPIGLYDQILPKFQFHLHTRLCIFGAESTGKTTMAKYLARVLPGRFVYEWARPYLEAVGPEITREAMTDIWHGQGALQHHVQGNFVDLPFTVFDTDLYSTIGYWNQPHWTAVLGEAPAELEAEAAALKSDLYIITRANIPFEEDPLRYGGDHRESPDEYWIDLAKEYDLNYIVLDGSDPDDRADEAMSYIDEVTDQKARSLGYDRGGF